MSAELINGCTTHCLGCGKELNIAEIHYYGTTCNECEGKWLAAMDAWRHGLLEDYPPRPGEGREQ